MATRSVITELSASFSSRFQPVEAVSVGGVDAARRVEAREPFDVVVLAGDALALLQQAGCLVPGSSRVVALSHMAIAVPAGTPAPAVATEAELIATLLAAPAIGYSTGPSGRALMAQLTRWGLLDQLQARLVQAPPGVPVAQLLAEGKAPIGFQQRSELMHDGVVIVGNMPPGVEMVTPFTGAVCLTSSKPEAAAAFIDWLCAPEAADCKRRYGLLPG